MPLTTQPGKSDRIITVDAGVSPLDVSANHNFGLADVNTVAIDPTTGNRWEWSGTRWFQTHISGIIVTRTGISDIPAFQHIVKSEPLFQFLSDTGLAPAGNLHSNVDGSATPVSSFIKPAANELIVLSRWTTHIQDSGMLDAGKYGNNITMTNGIEIIKAIGTDLVTDVIARFTMNIPIMTNGDWGRFGGNITHTDFGTGDNYISAQIDLTNTPLVIDGTQGEVLGILIQDDLTNLEDHTVYLEGIKYTIG